MSDFERSGMTFDEPAKRRSPGTWFADMGDRLARGFNNFDRPPSDEDEPEWEEYDEPEQPTAVADPVDWDPPQSPDKKRFPTSLHGYDRDAVDAHLDALERELVELRVHRTPSAAVQAEIERVGEETSAILRVAHEQAAEITRRAQTQADRCVQDAAANAVSMTEDAKRNLRQLDSETDAVWAERGRLIEDVRSVATALFSLAEDAADRFPEEGERRAPADPAPPMRAATAAPVAAPPATPSATPPSPPASAQANNAPAHSAATAAGQATRPPAQATPRGAGDED
ncbi:MAG TPA: DivIVA domain-containing protein [Solirubrobacteraceae bacterium]|nr:DivIVA domain-containing protein [Solirubrobacteraceae bacterium]